MCVTKVKDKLHYFCIAFTAVLSAGLSAALAAMNLSPPTLTYTPHFSFVSRAARLHTGRRRLHFRPPISEILLQFTSESACFYPRDAMLARVIVIATCLSVRPSVRPFVTRRYCVKTKKASGMISSPSGSPNTLVF